MRIDNAQLKIACVIKSIKVFKNMVLLSIHHQFIRFYSLNFLTTLIVFTSFFFFLLQIYNLLKVFADNILYLN